MAAKDHDPAPLPEQPAAAPDGGGAGCVVVGVGASAGGVEALQEFFAAMPADGGLAVVVVLHQEPSHDSRLAEVLGRRTSLPVAEARDGTPVEAGRVYVAPPDQHLVIEPSLVRLTRGPRENRFRPAIDPLFRSAAQVYGPRVVGVILTGYLDDGTAGLWTVKQLGGTAVVQDPEDALADSMPRSALRHVNVDHCLPLAGIASLLVRLSSEKAEEGGFEVPDETKIEISIAKAEKALEAGVLTLGEPSNYACP